MPCAHSSTLKPDGTLILSTGISPGAFGAGGCAIGDSDELSMSFGCPCFHDGGACWAARGPVASTKATATVTDSANRNVRSLMMDPPARQTDGWVGWRQTVARAPRLVNAGGVYGPALTSRPQPGQTPRLGGGAVAATTASKRSSVVARPRAGSHEYFVSHQAQPTLQPCNRTKTDGAPALAPSPCTETKTSLMRRGIAALRPGARRPRRAGRPPRARPPARAGRASRRPARDPPA